MVKYIWLLVYFSFMFPPNDSNSFPIITGVPRVLAGYLLDTFLQYSP
jgi:hypothetical protein